MLSPGAIFRFNFTDSTLVEQSNVASLWAFFSGYHFELNFVAVFKLGATSVVCVYKHVFIAIIGRDESKTFTCIKKLNFTSLHILSTYRLQNSTVLLFLLQYELKFL